MNTPGALLATVLSATAGWALLKLEPMHPVQLWSIPWALATDLYAAHLLPYRALTWETAILAMFATAAFVLGALVAARWSARTVRTFESTEHVVIERAATVTLVVTALLLLAFLAQAISRYGITGAVISPAHLRAGIAHADFTITIKYIYFAIAATALCAIASAMAPSHRRRVTWLCAALACVGSVYFATGRATIFDDALVAAVGFALARPKLLPRRRFLLGVLSLATFALVVFLAGGALIGKTYANNPDFHWLPSVFNQHRSLSAFALPYEYASAPIAALDVQVHYSTVWGESYGCAALHEVCVGLRKLGLDVPSIPSVRPFTAAPLPWNTYTALDVPLIDWGTALLTPVLALLGIASGLIWRAARSRRLVWLVVYSVEAVALVTSAGSFNFAAPDLVGAVIIALAAVWVARQPADRGVLRSHLRRARSAGGRVVDG